MTSMPISIKDQATAISGLGEYADGTMGGQMHQILIADDHELLRDVLKSYLELDGQFQVSTASDLPEALELIRSGNKFDLVVLDLRMPGMDGLAGLDEVVLATLGQPVALMSGLAPPNIGPAISRAGGAGYLPKTLPAKELVEAVRRLVAGEKFFPEEVVTADNVSSLPAPKFSPREQLHNALRNNEFFVVYQPIIDVRSGAWVGAEALMRWRQPNGNLISPTYFVPLAAAEGYASQLTDKLFELVARDSEQIFSAVPGFRLSLNVFASEVATPDFAERLATMLAQAKGTARNFALEIIENDMIDGENVKAALSKINEAGVQLCIDDFGRGNSNLSYLIDYDFQCIKIDRSFIQNISHSQFERQMFDKIINLIGDLNYIIVCEGVEDKSQEDYIKSLNLVYAQGWLYAKAMPLDDLLLGLQIAQTGSSPPSPA